MSYPQHYYTDWLHAECPLAQYHKAKTVMLSVNMISVFILIVNMLNVPTVMMVAFVFEHIQVEDALCVGLMSAA